MDALTRMHAMPLAYIAIDLESNRDTNLLNARHFFVRRTASSIAAT